MIVSYASVCLLFSTCNELVQRTCVAKRYRTENILARSNLERITCMKHIRDKTLLETYNAIALSTECSPVVCIVATKEKMYQI